MNNNDELAVGLRKEKRSISLIWVAPIIAILITAGMIWENYINAGARITIVVENGDGIRSGKTPIMYKGIKIGIVEDIHIKDDDVSKIELIAMIDNRAKNEVLRKGNKFWKVEPKISLTEVSGLNTIVSGIYISVMPAANTKTQLNSLPFEDHFIALALAPVNVFDPGLSVIVNTVDKGDIAIGAPVLYNKQAIGKVEDKKLSRDKKSIDLYLRIKTKYMDLVHEKSLFYKTDALDVKASLSGIKVKMGSFANFIAGGIGMYSSESCRLSPLAVDKARYRLYDDYEEIMLSEEEIVLLMNEHNTLEPGSTKLFYKGVEAGLVKEIKYDPVKNQTEVKIKIHNDFKSFANEKAYFWIVKPQLNFDHIDGLDAIVKGNYINFVTSNINSRQKTSFILHDKKPKQNGVHITVFTQDIKGLKEGAALSYRGIEIGTVSSYHINKDNKSFNIDLTVEPKYRRLLNASTVFYHNSGVELQAGLDGVDFKAGSLESILRGGIGVDTPDFDADKKLLKKYKLYADYAQLQEHEYLNKDGVYLTLIANELGSLKQGSAIYYRQIKVGKILSYKWDAKNKNIVFKAFIVAEYAKEVHDNSLFYNASGIDAKFDLSGLEINSESIETIVTGGLAFYTPSSQEAKVARNHEQFRLYETKAKAMNKYTNITLHSKDSFGLITGNIVMYKSVVIGHVEKVRLVKEGVELDLKIDSQYAYLMKEDSLFWTEAFQMNLQGIENFSAALKGTFIVLSPGISSKSEKHFHLQAEAPPAHLNEKGLRVILDASRLSGIKKHTPVYFRQVKIGSVVQYHLKEDATGVNVEIFIEPCFSHLIRKNSYFFNASGIGMDVSLFGAKVKTETLESIITGGIGVLSPDDYEDEAQDKDVFILNENFDEDALDWAPKLFSNKQECT